MGPLLSDLAAKMQTKAEKGDADPTKILIHSTHDTCLAGLANTLDIFDEKYVYRLYLNASTDAIHCKGGLPLQLPLHSSCSRSGRKVQHQHLRGRTCCHCLVARPNQQSTVCFLLATATSVT